MRGAKAVGVEANVSGVFSEPVRRASLTRSTVKLVRKGTSDRAAGPAGLRRGAAPGDDRPDRGAAPAHDVPGGPDHDGAGPGR